MAELLAHLTARGDAVALLDEAGPVTWERLNARVNRWVHLLRSYGLTPGDPVALVLGNRRETFEALLACLHSGLTAVPVNWHLTRPEVAYILRDSGARVVLSEPAYAANTAAAGVRRLVTGDVDVDGCTAVEPRLAGVSEDEPVDQTCGSTMLYTSGTTGEPKGVVNNLFVTGAPFGDVARLLSYAQRVLGVPTEGTVLLCGPWYHSAQLFFALLPILGGVRLVLHQRFDAERVLRTIDAQRVTACHLVPTQFVRLLQLDPRARAGFDGASLRRVWHGGGPCAERVKRQMLEWWGPVLVEYYAATEGGVVTLIDAEEWLRHPGSVGRAIPPNEVLIVDDTGQPVPVGRTGRVFVRRRRSEGFRYHNAPEKTKAAHLGRGVFTYGELGYVDSAGYLYLTGRAQQLIISGGVNIYPAEVEAVLATHPAVRDVAVVGEPDDEYGERVVAVVEVADSLPAELVSAVLDRHCRLSLAGFKVPRRYRVVPELPRDESGKLRRDAVLAVAGS